MKKAILILAVVVLVCSLALAFAGCQTQKGDKGDTGATGATGAQGIQGEKGDRGLKGDKGDTGVKGGKGDDGISINWLGTRTNSPSNPSLNDAYYNSIQRASYIWDGNSWEILARDGVVGMTGADGIDGIDGADGVDCACYAKSVVLIQKVTSEPWPPILGGAVAVLQYNPVGVEFEYRLEAHSLNPEEYCLVYYYDYGADYPYGDVYFIDGGVPDGLNTLILEGSVNLNFDIPLDNGDLNFPNGKIWLVTSDAYSGDASSAIGYMGNITDWSLGGDFLYEYAPIIYIDIDD